MKPRHLAEIVRFSKFALIGCAALVLKLGVTYLLTDILGLWYFLSFILAAFITWTAIFFANSIFTFRGHSSEGYVRRYLVFMGSYLSTFWVNALIVFLLTSVVSVNYLISITVAAILTSLLTYTINARVVFRDTEHER